MLGPLLFIAISRMASAPVVSSANLRYLGQWGIGVSLGLYFTPYVVSVIAQNIWPILAGMVFAICLGLYGTFVFRKLGGVHLQTAWFSAAIGGASEMTVLSERYGGRADLVASAHSLRILTVVVVIPIAFQIWGVAGTDARGSRALRTCADDGLALRRHLEGGHARGPGKRRGRRGHL